jgi:hypothetical protein
MSLFVSFIVTKRELPPAKCFIFCVSIGLPTPTHFQIQKNFSFKKKISSGNHLQFKSEIRKKNFLLAE